jgi:hypothetical protein
MASKSHKNVISILSLCEGTAIMVEKAYQQQDRTSKSLLGAGGIVPRLYKACHAAHCLWPADMDEKTIKQLADQMEQMEQTSFAGSQQADVSAYTSLCLDLLNDLFGRIKNPTKLAALDEVHKMMLQLHRYFDSRNNRWAAYEIGGKAADTWRKSAMA